MNLNKHHTMELKNLARIFREAAPQVPAPARKSAHNFTGEHNDEITRVEYPIPLRTVSQPTDTKNISKALRYYVRQICNIIPLTAPQVKAENIVQSPNTENETLTWVPRIARAVTWSRGPRPWRGFTYGPPNISTCPVRVLLPRRIWPGNR